MQTPVSMYYANLTNIDLAMILPSGHLRGDSFNLHLELSGQEDPVESVLIDFSSAKKKIKSWIDDHEGNGFDHKCWVFRHREFDVSTSVDDAQENISLQTPFVKIKAPANCFRFIHCTNEKPTLLNMIKWASASIEEYVRAKFLQDGQNITVRASLTNNFSYPVFANPELNGFSFRYTHGLKQSTSFGCQNVVHGHLSYIAFEQKPGHQAHPGSCELYKDEISKITQFLNDKIFVWEQNVESIDNHILHIGYTTHRGTMSQSLIRNTAIILSEETTVEHIAQYVASKFATTLRSLGVARVYVSEGLEKGGSAVPGGTYTVSEITE